MSKILVIEDEPLIRQNLIEILQLEGHQVVGAEDGQAGIQQIDTFAPDLILCDIILSPGIDGYEVLKYVRNQSAISETPFIILTAKSNPEDEEEGLALGADAYLLKPIKPEEMLETLRKFLHP